MNWLDYMHMICINDSHKGHDLGKIDFTWMKFMLLLISSQEAIYIEGLFINVPEALGRITPSMFPKCTMFICSE